MSRPCEVGVAKNIGSTFYFFCYCCYLIVALLLYLSDIICPSPVPVDKRCKFLYGNVRSLKRNLSDLNVTSLDYDVFCFKNFLSDFRNASELFIPVTNLCL